MYFYFLLEFVSSSSVPVSLSSELIVSILSDVSHPRQSLVARLLYDLQISHLQHQWHCLLLFYNVSYNCYLYARGRKIWNLKLDIYGRLSLVQIPIHAWKEKLCLHEIFFSSGKWLDGPTNCILFWDILAMTWQ